MQTIAFPMRLQESGLLRRQDEISSVIALLHVMARTPAGSWQGCPSFGLRDLFDSPGARADLGRLAKARINAAFEDLGLGNFSVSEIVREMGGQRDVDTYAITINQAAHEESFTAVVTRAL